MTSRLDPWTGDLLPQLIERRHQLSLTQCELEDRIGVTGCLVAKWECGMRTPRAFLLSCWAEALGARLVVVPTVHNVPAPSVGGGRRAGHRTPL